MFLVNTEAHVIVIPDPPDQHYQYPAICSLQATNVPSFNACGQELMTSILGLGRFFQAFFISDALQSILRMYLLSTSEILLMQNTLFLDGNKSTQAQGMYICTTFPGIGLATIKSQISSILDDFSSLTTSQTLPLQNHRIFGTTLSLLCSK